MDATAEKLMMAVRDKIDSDELLREDLMVWSAEMGDGMANQMYRAVDHALRKIQAQFDAQVHQQKEYVKKFSQSFAIYGILFGVGLGLLLIVCILKK